MPRCLFQRLKSQATSWQRSWGRRALSRRWSWRSRCWSLRRKPTRPLGVGIQPSVCRHWVGQSPKLTTWLTIKDPIESMYVKLKYQILESSFFAWLRPMIKNAKEWAVSRGLQRTNEVHGEDEFRVPTESSFSYTNTKKREGEGSGTMEVQDPTGSLFDFSDMSEQATIMYLGCFIIFSVNIFKWPFE